MLPVKVQAADRHCWACEYLAAKEPDISPQALVGSKTQFKESREDLQSLNGVSVGRVMGQLSFRQKEDN